MKDILGRILLINLAVVMLSCVAGLYAMEFCDEKSRLRIGLMRAFYGSASFATVLMGVILLWLAFR